MKIALIHKKYTTHGGTLEILMRVLNQKGLLIILFLPGENI
jgi:hypothetical protein